MELTKEQIQYIDRRLENDGVTYWDVRIELLDHVVCDIEKKLTLQSSEKEFKEIVQESFISLGWKENFNGGCFEKVYLERVTYYNKKVQREIRKEILDKLKETATIISVSLFLSYLFIFRNNAVIIKYTAIIMVIMLVISFIGSLSKYKIVKSAKFNALLLFTSAPLGMFNFFMFSPQVFFGYEKLGSDYIALLLGCTVPFLVIIISLLLKEIKSSQKKYNKFIS
jgi:hypothetical protein